MVLFPPLFSLSFLCDLCGEESFSFRVFPRTLFFFGYGSSAKTSTCGRRLSSLASLRFGRTEICFGMTKICHFERNGKSRNLLFFGVMEFLFMNVKATLVSGKLISEKLISEKLTHLRRRMGDRQIISDTHRPLPRIGDLPEWPIPPEIALCAYRRR